MKSTILAYLLPVVLMLTLSSSRSGLADTGAHVAKVTDVEGTVTLFTHPSPAKSDSRESPVKSGDPVNNGDILRTGPRSKARVIYPNGDQFYVGPQTSYRISWKEGDDSGAVDVDLNYGELRGVVQKGGPMRHLTIRTRAAVMGVRGTDFYVRVGLAPNATNISVLRGQVEVRPEAPQAKAVPVDAGFSVKLIAPAKSATSDTAASVREPATRKTSKEELRDIQADAVIHPAGSESGAPPSPEIQALQKKAFETTLLDVKESDPKAFAQIANSGVKSVDDLNRAVIEQEAATAPSRPWTARKQPSAAQERREERRRRYLEEHSIKGTR